MGAVILIGSMLLLGIIYHVLLCNAATLSTVAALWGAVYNSHERAPVDNSFVICVLEAGTLIASCSGTFDPYNVTHVPVSVRIPLYALSGGGYFSCGLVYGTKKAVCWGDPSVTNTSFAYKNTEYSSLSSGFSHVCALRDTGGVDCWGRDKYGETQPPDGYSFKLISSGWEFTCGLTERGEARCWGHGANKTDQPDNIYYSDISSGGNHVCALERKNRRPFCWGSNEYNQSTPPSSRAFSAITSGKYHSCGIVNDTGNVVCWGDDTFKQVGDAPKEETFSSIVAGDFYTCGLSLKQLQTVTCWGNSIAYTPNVKVSQGLCEAGQCDGGSYELPDKAVSGGERQCPGPGERICIDTCIEDCASAPAAAPSSSSKTPTDASVPVARENESYRSKTVPMIVQELSATEGALAIAAVVWLLINLEI